MFKYILGLTSIEAKQKLKESGPNQIFIPAEITFWGIARHEVVEPMILLLLVVGLFYSWWGEAGDAITIFVVIFLLVFAEVYNEFRAKKAIASLEKIATPKTKVLRDGKVIEIDSEEVVVGDILILFTGTKISADAKIQKTLGLQIDESALTGESFAEDKNIDQEIYAGTIVVGGEGQAEVVAIGKNTKLGKIATTMQVIKPPKTALQLSMKSLAGKLVYLSLFFSTIILLIGLWQGQDFKSLILTSLSLAFATIPEELPIIITMVLGLGAYKLSKNNFLIKKIKAAEMLGNATVIATDKTGTITEGKMKIVALYPNDEVDILKKSLSAFSEYSLSAMEKEIKDRADKLQIKINSEIIGQRNFHNSKKTKSVIRKDGDNYELFTIGAPEEIFGLCNGISDDVKNELNNQTIKGRRVIAVAWKRLNREEWINEKTPQPPLSGGLSKLPTSSISSSGMSSESSTRSALSSRGISETSANLDFSSSSEIRTSPPDKGGWGVSVGERANQDFTTLEKNMTFGGLISFEDSPRAGVKETIAKARHAGIKTIMITGDHPLTANFIAQEVGITTSGQSPLTGSDLDKLNDKQLQEVVKNTTVFARTTPEHKYRIVQALQKNGEVVAVTGDGINDVLALKSADIGIAMGIKGTDVAREAAEVVLADDNYNTIAQGIFEGRKFFDNLQKGIKYYLSVKSALILVFLLPTILLIPLPLAPIQIIVLELFMDLAASAGFVAEPAEADIYSRSPRNPKEDIFNNQAIKDILIKGVTLFFTVISVYFYAYYNNFPQHESETFAFTAWVFGHLMLAYVSRFEKESIFSKKIFTNKIINLWSISAITCLLLGIYLPVLSTRFNLVAINLSQLIGIAVYSMVIVGLLEVRKIVK